MPWTGEDTKDVFKKVIGGLIAAAVVAMGYAVMEDMPWYFAASLGVGLVVLVLLLVWRLSAQKAPEAKPVEPSADDSKARVSSTEPASTSEHAPERAPSPEEKAGEKEAESKALKKIAKAEQKRLKKEAKAKKKSAE